MLFVLDVSLLIYTTSQLIPVLANALNTIIMLVELVIGASYLAMIVCRFLNAQAVMMPFFLI